jgi:hypothetical protein
MTTVKTTPARTPFVEAWERAEKITGWLSRREAQALHRAAIETPKDGLIVEVGAFRGKSTALLASTGRQVVSIDPLTIGNKVDGERRITADDADSLRSVVDGFPNASWIRRESTAVDPYIEPTPIDLLYIDGNHNGDAPYNDFIHFQPKMKPGGLVAFHDFDAMQGVTQSVRKLEKQGMIQQHDLVGTLYIGKCVGAPQQPATTAVRRAFLALPNNHDIESETWESARDCVKGRKDISAYVWRRQFSILPANFNRCVVNCLNAGSFDFFSILHSDISVDAGWLGVIMDEMDRVGADVMHASVPIKNGEGLSSTAIGYSDDPWSLVRRVTMTELHQLPETYDLKTVQEVIDPEAKRLLCNTGCLVIRICDWFKNFTGFRNLDRIVRLSEDVWQDDTVPEDWNFGHWCADNGVNVWGTRKAVTHHWGRQRFSSDMIWGQAVDQFWLKHKGAA